MPQYACVLHTFCDLLQKDARIRSCGPRVKLRGNSTSLSLFFLSPCVYLLSLSFSPYPSIHTPLPPLALFTPPLSLPLFLSLLPRTNGHCNPRFSRSLGLCLSFSSASRMASLSTRPSLTLPYQAQGARRKARSTARRSFGLCVETRPGSVHLRALCALRCARACACCSWLDGWVDEDRTAGGFCTLFRRPSGVLGGSYLEWVAGLFEFFAVVSNRFAGNDGGWWIAVGAVGSLVCRRIGICGVAQAVCVSDRFRVRGRVRVRVRVRVFQSAGMAWGYRFVTLIRAMHDSRCQ
jgi:hypothetical protein